MTRSLKASASGPTFLHCPALEVTQPTAASTSKPRFASNVLHACSALELKNEGMIKLPVDLESREDWLEVLAATVQRRNELETVADHANQDVGIPFYRPIALIQAQAKHKAKQTHTVEAVKDALVNRLEVPEHEVKIRLPLNIFTRNHVGTTFGGSIYSAVDGIFGILLFRHLSPEYLAVLKTCEIRYKRPGRGTLYTTLSILKEDFDSIRKELKSKSSTERLFKFDIVDKEGVVYAEFSPTIFIS